MRSRQKHKARPPAAAARRAAQIVTNMDAWHGPSGYDVRHRAVVSYVYQLPFGQGRRWMGDAGGLLDGTVGGWQLSGITTMTTGRAFTVFLQTGVNNGASSWPNRIRVREARQPVGGHVVQPRGLPGATPSAPSHLRVSPGARLTSTDRSPYSMT